ncbi:MAG: 6,7-dimethyl-8-ribityllumazine synthase [Actinobacteria bacterium]|nr:6,7-dimethyl-8-ribityllumazine synthase [Actinomycetota bacterium]
MKASPEFGDADGGGLRIGVAAAMFNGTITEALLKWCREGLLHSGVSDADIIVEWVPGAFELPLAARVFAIDGGVDAVVCLGAVIRGDTAHFEYVAGEAARGIQEVALETGVPVMFGVLTTDTVEQAEERSRDDETNKGYEAARGAVHMARVLERIRGGA